MNLYKQFETNDKLEANGIWIEYGLTEEGDSIAFLLARSGGQNIRYAKVLEAKTKPYKRQIQSKTLHEDIAKKIMLETFAETCVLGWRNIRDANNEPLAFTTANVSKLLSDLPELFSDLRDTADDVTLFRKFVQEEDAGN